MRFFTYMFLNLEDYYGTVCLSLPDQLGLLLVLSAS